MPPSDSSPRPKTLLTPGLDSAGSSKAPITASCTRLEARPSPTGRVGRHTALSAGTVCSPSHSRVHHRREENLYPRSSTHHRAALPVFWRGHAASVAKRWTDCHACNSTIPSQQQVPIKQPEQPATPCGSVPTDSSGPAGVLYLASAGPSGRSEATQAAPGSARSSLIESMRLLSTDERVPYILPAFRWTKLESAKALPRDHCAPQKRPYTGSYLLAIMAR